MCVSSHHFPCWQPNRLATPNMKNILFTTSLSFLFLQACDGHPGRLCDTDGWVRASFPWVKYQASVRPVTADTHIHTSPCTQTQSMLGSLCDAHVSRYIFFPWVFLLSAAASWPPNGWDGSGLRGRKKAFTCVTHQGGGRTLVFAWCQVVYRLASRGESRRREMAALSHSASHFVFSWHHLQTLCGVG